MNKSVIIALGANISSPYTNIQKAIIALKASPYIDNLIQASIYKTSPVGGIKQPDFLNTCCQLETRISCSEFFKLCQSIEKKLGKGPKEKMGPRPIDIDIIFFGKETHHSKEMCIPHPHWKERLFVLYPLKDLIQSVNNCDIDILIEEAESNYSDTVSPILESSFSKEST
jgi:2-amino-4-hydroxy-6-hydroxymethyldihydropteridine diphosphokinase